MDLASFSLLGLELHRGLKAIHIHAQCPVEFRELPVRQFSDKAIIANHLPHNLSVLLLDVTLIIASSWAPSGKGNLLWFTKGEQLDIDELRSIIRVNAQDGERKQVLSTLESSDDRLLTFVDQRKAFGPSVPIVAKRQAREKRPVVTR